MVEALVIGAGPAGCAAAIHLARAGREVLLVDRCRFPRPKPCGEFYNPGCARLLRGLGLMDALDAAGARTVPRLRFGASGARELRVGLTGVGGGNEGALTLPRETLDALMLDAARAAGVRVWEGADAREPLIERGSVAGAAIRVDGRERRVRARLTLAADGLRSRFARRLGLGRGCGRRRTLGLTARYDAAAGAPEGLTLHGSASICCGVVIRGEEANLGLVLEARRARELGGAPAAFLLHELRGHPALAAHLDGGPRLVRTVGPLSWVTANQSAAGCLLLGDAAGFYDPFTGQGVTFALLTAELGAEVAAAALAENDVSRERLEEYSRRRRRIIEPRIRVQRAVQAVLARPGLLAHCLERLRRRHPAAEALVGVVADVLPASRLLSPAFLGRLFF